jgi:hypothetical protein
MLDTTGRNNKLSQKNVYISYYFIVRLKQNNKIITKIFFHLVSFGCLCIDWSLPLPGFFATPAALLMIEYVPSVDVT